MNRSHIRLLGILRLLKGSQWAAVAREAQRAGRVDHLLEGRCFEKSRMARDVIASIAAQRALLSEAEEAAEAAVRQAAENGINLTTVIDRDYPENLRSVPQVPPFLFYRGTLLSTDVAALSVVGTRRASEEGLIRASSLARMLGRCQVTVVSGLARGIDTAAHEACLDAGGRTIGVLGAGHYHFYPPENRALATRMESNGAVVSQFWPDTHPSRATFPIRNAVSSGLSLGTVVIEASHTSGAKMQARLALEQGRYVLLPESLVRDQAWAQQYVQRGAAVVSSIDALERDLGGLLRAARVERGAHCNGDSGDEPRLFAVG